METTQRMYMGAWRELPRCTILAAAASLLFVSCGERSGTVSRQRLPEFGLTPTDYGWKGHFPGGPHKVFDKPFHVQIDTRAIPTEPKVLPPVSLSQAALIRRMTPDLLAILKRVEEAMVKFNEQEPQFREFLTNPHVWFDSEEDNGESWAFVIERTDNPDFGYHVEFRGTNFVEIWGGD